MQKLKTRDEENRTLIRKCTTSQYQSDFMGQLGGSSCSKDTTACMYLHFGGQQVLYFLPRKIHTFITYTVTYSNCIGAMLGQQ